MREVEIIKEQPQVEMVEKKSFFDKLLYFIVIFGIGFIAGWATAFVIWIIYGGRT